MPIIEVGDLVVPRYIDEPDDWDAFGIIVGIRDNAIGPVYNVLWNDVPEPRWCSHRSIRPAREARPQTLGGETGQET